MPLYERLTIEFPVQPETKLYSAQTLATVNVDPPTEPLLSSDNNRKLLTIKNAGTQKVFLGLKALFDRSESIIDIEPDGYYEFPVDGNGGIYVGNVYARTESGETNLVLTQFTNVPSGQ